MNFHRVGHTKLNEVNTPERSGYSLVSVGLLALGLAMITVGPALGSGNFNKTGSTS